jgi:hypothetical protein
MIRKTGYGFSEKIMLKKNRVETPKVDPDIVHPGGGRKFWVA